MNTEDKEKAEELREAAIAINKVLGDRDMTAPQGAQVLLLVLSGLMAVEEVDELGVEKTIQLLKRMHKEHRKNWKDIKREQDGSQ